MILIKYRRPYLCINLTQTCYQLLLTNYFYTIKTYTTTPHESHTISIYLTPIPPWHLDQLDTMARMLNFYSYELFVPRACARDDSPRRSNIH